MFKFYTRNSWSNPNMSVWSNPAPLSDQDPERRQMLQAEVDQSEIPNSQPESRNPKPEARNPQSETRNPKPETRNPEP